MTKEQKLNGIVKEWENWALRQNINPCPFDYENVTKFYYDYLPLSEHRNLLDFKSEDPWQEVQGAIRKFCDN